MTTITEQQIPTGTWHLDPIHSSASFAVKHVVSTFKGAFSELSSASLTNENGTPVLRGSVAVDSIQIRDENLRGHLLSPEFFDVANTPEITFTSRDLRVDGHGQITAEGDLTIRGVTRPVTVTGTLEGPAEGLGGAQRIGIELATTVDRNEFGLTWNAPLPGGRTVLADHVTLNVHLELVEA